MLQRVGLSQLVRASKQAQIARTTHSQATVAHAATELLERVLEIGRRWRHRALAARWRRQAKHPHATLQTVGTVSDRQRAPLVQGPSISFVAASALAHQGKVEQETADFGAKSYDEGDLDVSSSSSELASSSLHSHDGARGPQRPAPRQPIELFLSGVRQRTAVVQPSELLRSHRQPQVQVQRQATSTDDRGNLQTPPRSGNGSTESRPRDLSTNRPRQPLSLVQSTRSGEGKGFLCDPEGPQPTVQRSLRQKPEGGSDNSDNENSPRRAREHVAAARSEVHRVPKGVETEIASLETTLREVRSLHPRRLSQGRTLPLIVVPLYAAL